MIADGEENAMSPDGRHQLLNEESQQGRADRGEVEVMDHKQGVQFHRREPLHNLPTAEDDDIVGDEEDGGLGEGGQRSDTLDELELGGGIADDILEGLVEDGP